MCLAVPGLVVKIADKTASVDFGGIRRPARIDLLPNVEAGEYVLVHAGFVIQRIETGEAESLLDGIVELPGATEKRDAENGGEDTPESG
jgi:hydrogenase expression/formation protein HypC